MKFSLTRLTDAVNHFLEKKHLLSHGLRKHFSKSEKAQLIKAKLKCCGKEIKDMEDTPIPELVDKIIIVIRDHYASGESGECGKVSTKDKKTFEDFKNVWHVKRVNYFGVH